MQIINGSLRPVQIFLFLFVSVSFLSCKDVAVDAEKELEDPDLILADSFLLAHHGFDAQLGNWFENSLCCSWSAQIDRVIKRSGTGSARFELRRGDSAFKYQAQFGRAPSRSNEAWYGFSLYFPNSFVKDSIEESIVQWQSVPDFALGEEWRSAPLFLGVLNDSLVLEIRTDINKVTLQGKADFTRINLGLLDKEAWLDWVFHVKWACDDTGILEIWKNGKLVLTRNNRPNTYNDARFPYIKVGINKWDWETTQNAIIERVVYVDEVTVGKGNAGYERVKPGR